MDFGNGAGQDNLILANVGSGAGVTYFGKALPTSI